MYRITTIRHFFKRKIKVEKVNILVKDIERYRKKISKDGEKIFFIYDKI